jgi:hypothetical protein
MKRLIIFLFCIKSIFCFSQSITKKQTLIPLDNLKGVPFFKDRALYDIGIDGFEIDEKGKFYFYCAEKGCLAVFSKNTPVYRKIYHDFHGTSLYIFNGDLYTFSFGGLGVNDLICLNLNNGLVKKRYNHLTSQNIASYTFADSSIIIGTQNTGKDLFFQYNLKGRYIKQVSNRYNIPSNIFPPKIQEADWEFAGKWNDKFVFWNINPESTKNEKLCLVDETGKILITKLLPENFSGDEGYVGNPPEDRKVRNGSLFVLGRRGKSALITEVPLENIFGK